LAMTSVITGSPIRLCYEHLFERSESQEGF